MKSGEILDWVKKNFGVQFADYNLRLFNVFQNDLLAVK
jgi:hypothetical protein